MTALRSILLLNVLVCFATALNVQHSSNVGVLDPKVDDSNPNVPGYAAGGSLLPSLRFQSLDTVTAGLYADISKRLNTQITESPRAMLQTDPSKPPIIIFSDICLLDGAGSTVSSDPAATTIDNVAQPQESRSSSQQQCKATSSITIDQLKRALAARTAGSKGAFLCEYKAANKYVHCVLQPDHTVVKQEFTALQQAAAEANRLSAKLGGGASSAPAVASVMGDSIRQDSKSLHHGPCRLAIDGSGRHVIPTLKLGLSDSTTMTVYTSCPSSKRKGNVFGGGALIGSDDINMLREAAAKLAKNYTRASCHCRVMTLAAGGDVDISDDATVRVSMRDLSPQAAQQQSAAGLSCQCVELSKVAPALGASTQDGNDAVLGRVGGAKKQLFSYWQRLHDLAANTTALRSSVDRTLEVLRSHYLAGPVVAGGLKGVASAGPNVDSAAVGAYQSFDPHAQRERPNEQAHARFAHTANSIWSGSSKDESEVDTPKYGAKPADLLYVRLGHSSGKRITPAYTSTAAGELSALTTLLQRYIGIMDEISSLVPEEADHEKIRNAPLPAIVEEHVRQLKTVQERLKRDISLAAARVDAVPNTDPDLISRAMKALATSSPEGVYLVRRLVKSSGSQSNKEVGSLLANTALSAMYITHQQAGMCAMWPRCASLVGGTALQEWLLRRIGSEAQDAIPTGDACSDGGVAPTKSPELQMSAEAHGGPVNETGTQILSLTTVEGDNVHTEGDPELAQAIRSAKQAVTVQKNKDNIALHQRPHVLQGKVQLLSLRAWCDSEAPVHVIEDVARMLYKFISQAEPQPTPSPSASPMSSPPTAEPLNSPSPSSQPLTLQVTELSGEDALAAAAVVRTSDTSVKPIDELQLTSIVSFLQQPEVAEHSINPSIPSPPHMDLVWRAISQSENARSLILRMNGTLACTCLFAGSPTTLLHRQPGPAPKLDHGSSWKSIIRNFTLSRRQMLDELLGLDAQLHSPPSDALQLPNSSSLLFAHIARDEVELPPSSDQQSVGYLDAIIQNAKSEIAARQKLMLESLRNNRTLHGSDSEFELQKLQAESTQVGIERSRLTDLLKSRIVRIRDDLKQRLTSLNESSSELAGKLRSSHALTSSATSAARQSREADLQYVQDLMRLLAQLKDMANAAKSDGDAMQWIAGCQGGGGDTGATLALKQATALQKLASAQTSLQRLAEDAMDPLNSPATRASTLQSIETIQQEIDDQHAGVLALSLQFEIATCQCVQRVTGIPCRYAIANTNGSSTADSSPLDKAAAGNVSQALTDARLAQQQLAAATAALEGERRRWEEAVVRLVRPKTCLQLQALATGGTDGIYTIFPPDDLQHRGVRVFCDMITDGGGWTLVANAPNGILGGPLTVSNGAYDAGDRSSRSNLNSLWIVQASSEVAISWNVDSAAVGAISSYGSAIAFNVPDPMVTTLATMPPPPIQSCQSDSGDYSAVNVRCLVVRGANSSCALPPRMYTGTTTLATCMGHAYGVVLRSSPDVCDGFLPITNNGTRATTAGDIVANAGVFVSTDGTPGCAGVLQPGMRDATLPALVSIWFR